MARSPMVWSRRLIWVAVALAVSASSIGLALRPSVDSQLVMWLTIGVPNVALATLAVLRLRRQGLLAERLKPRWGDPSVGAVTGLLLVLGTWVGRTQLMPTGSPQQAWLAQIFWMLGDPAALQRSVLMTGLVLLVPASEELVWRGLVLGELTRKFGKRRAWPLSAVLYGLAAVPTTMTLAVSGVGANPLLVLAALGCGLVWGFMVSQTQRLPAAILSHMVFTYFSATQLRVPGM